jgi:hypothetical protein
MWKTAYRGDWAASWWNASRLGKELRIGAAARNSGGT